MPGNPKSWNPKEWELHIQALLKRRYAHPPGSYQQVPDTVEGDRGIEGFAKDGTAYQCYAAQDWVTASQLLKRQKNKITADIGKFIKNETELVKILGNVKISRWNFVVPYWSDKDLKIHGNRKAIDVVKLMPKHIDAAFCISILTDEDFAVEAQLLANVNLQQFDSPAPLIGPSRLAEWMRQRRNLKYIGHLRRKVDQIGRGKSAEAKESFQARMVADYIRGAVILGRLQGELPETHAKVMDYKSTREANLESESFVTSKVPAQFFEATLEQYRDELAAVPGISPRAADILAREAVSDWLLRCPMEFD